MKTANVLLGLALVASGCVCDGGGGGGGGDTGSVAGKVSFFQGAQSTERKAAPARFSGLLAQLKHAAQDLRLAKPPAAHPKIIPPGPLLGAGQGRRRIAGDALVRFEDVISAETALDRLALPGYRLTHGGFSSEWLHLVRATFADGRELSEPDTGQLIEALSQRQGVRFATFNGVRWAQATPNDSLYAAQWHYPAIQLPASWETSRGGNGVVVAVLDTGVVSHPDLQGRLLAGIDMVSDRANGADGDGRDDDPTDMGGDLPQGRSSWHGTHVAGTIGASTDNALGVAGVDWNARILPVRVIGRDGASDADILAGITWATGGTVPGARANPTPAQVLNMSLGGEGEPSPATQDVIDQAAGRGGWIVIAAGNDDIDASRFNPCNQTNVLCVGATRFDGRRASYSNFGARVDVMAPGGEVAEDLNGDGEPDGVLSTSRDGTMPAYQFLQGTSMASPHVAGVMALLRAAAPGLTFAQARQALVSTAAPESRCAEGCGAGLINALAALRAVGGQVPTGPGRLVASTTSIFLSEETPRQSLSLTNVGGGPVAVQLSAMGPLRIESNAQLTIAAGASARVDVSAATAGLPAGVSAGNITAATANEQLSISAKVRAGAAPRQDAVVALVYQKADESWEVAAAQQTSTATGGTFNLEASEGTYYIFGWVDSNRDEEYQDNEPVGFWPTSTDPREVPITAGEALAGADFALAPLQGIDERESQTIGVACGTDAECAPGACITEWPGGYCSANCAMSPCPLGAVCLESGTIHACLEACAAPGGGQSSCRSQYVCYSDGTGNGVCWPRCTADEDCGEQQACDTATGYCG